METRDIVLVDGCVSRHHDPAVLFQNFVWISFPDDERTL
jgi:hypothetical protein